MVEKKKRAFRDQKKNPLKKPTAQILFKSKRESFSFFKKKSIRTNKEKYQKISFLHCSSFKHSIEANKIQGSQFSSQEHNQNGEHPLKGNQYCINIFFYSFLYYFFVLFNFLFDSIYFYFCVDYLLIIFIIFDILMGGMV